LSVIIVSIIIVTSIVVTIVDVVMDIVSSSTSTVLSITVITVVVIVVPVIVIVILLMILIIVTIVIVVSIVLCRQEVYSCWSTASGARVNNYGARIDLILLAEPAIAGQADAAHDVKKPDVSSNIAFPVLASMQQQQSRYRIMLISSKTCISIYLSHVFAIYVMAPIRQQ